MSTLDKAKVGKNYRLARIEGGKDNIRESIDLGIAVGVALGVVSNRLDGPIVINIQGNRVGIGRRHASKVWLRKI